MRVIVTDPHVPREAVEADGYRWVGDFHEALAEADVVSLGLSMTPENRGFFSDAEFSRMRPTAFIVNTSRGLLIDEAALIRALEAGRIAGAGLDVLEQEPPAPDNPLLRMDRVVFTPHSGAYNRETLDRMAVSCARNALDALDGRLDPRCVVNPEVL
jgi:D-3-phosphoglycerate dehydrogenase / 2-oxoglutarate reductase